MLVKLGAPLAQQVEAALSMQTMTLTADQPMSASARSFMRRYSSEKIRPLHPSIVRAKKQRGSSDKELAAAIRQKFPKRAKRLSRVFTSPEISRSYVLEIDTESGQDLKQILRRLKADPNVEFAEEDKAVSANLVPNDPFLQSSGSWGQPWDDLWGLKRMGAPAAWDTSAGDGVIVAVVDTGLDYNHPDIAGNVWTNPNEIPDNFLDDDDNGYPDDVRGWDFVFFGNDPIDRRGHGTHLSGTVGATGDNGIGVIGVAWRAKVMPIKALDDGGNGFDSWQASAIIYAANNGADVINNSWTGSGSSQFVTEAVEYAYSLGAVVVASAGNNSDDARNYYPANLPNVITVAAIHPFGFKADFSNFGSKIDVAAPGVDVLSLRAANGFFGVPIPPDFSYAFAQGTSTAAAHVSGVAALILSQHPEYSNEDVKQVLRVSANSPSGGYDLDFGYGEVNAAAAMTIIDPLQVKISSPAHGTVVEGPVEITGFARGPGFLQYLLEYGAGTQPFNWTVFHGGSTPTTGALGVFDPGAVFADGTYTLRLRAFNTSGAVFSDRAQVTVRSAAITSPAIPRVPTSANIYKTGVSIPILGTATGGNFQNFVMEWGRGRNPEFFQNDGMNLTGGGFSPVSNGVLATWDTSAITDADYYTIRLLVFKGSGTTQVLTLIYLEPDLLSASWPVFLDQGPNINSGLVPAMNADGALRLLVASPASGPLAPVGALWTLSPNGSAQKTALVSFGSDHHPSVAELDGLPGEEAAVADEGVVRIFHEDGSSETLVPSVPIDLTRNQLVLEDLDGDFSREVLAVGSNFNNDTAYIYAWRADGTVLNNFPIQIGDRNNLRSFQNRNRLIAGDFDGDGSKEILVQEGLTASTYTLRIFGSDGLPRAWNSQVFTGIPFAMIAADLDKNGKLQTILTTYVGTQATLHVLQSDGTERPGWPIVLTNVQQFDLSFLAAGDLDRDGTNEIVLSRQSQIDVFRADGSSFSGGWPLAGGFPGFGAVVLADVDGDGTPEIVTTRNQLAESFDHKLLAIRGDASILRSWQLTAMNGLNLELYPLPSVGDFNQDGLTDISVSYIVSGPGNATGGVVTMLNTGTPFDPAADDWPMYLQNARNTATLTRDRTAPSVAITSPAHGADVFGSVTIAASVNDDFGVAGVQFQVDGVNFGAPDTTAPYSVPWDLSTVGLGSHVLTAIARDTAGNLTTSARVTVNVVAGPSAAFSTGALAFGAQVVGTSSVAQPVSLTNTGSVPLSVAGFTATEGFSETNNCVPSLAPGASCTVSVVFTPTAAGVRSGTLTLNSNISGPAPVVALSGTGLDYALSVSPSSVTIRTGRSARITIRIEPLGGSFDLPVSLTCSGLPTESKCKFASTTVTPGSTSATIELKLTTEGRSRPLGTSTITIEGMSSHLQRSTSVQVTLKRSADDDD